MPQLLISPSPNTEALEHTSDSENKTKPDNKPTSQIASTLASRLTEATQSAQVIPIAGTIADPLIQKLAAVHDQLSAEMNHRPNQTLVKHHDDYGNDLMGQELDDIVGSGSSHTTESTTASVINAAKNKLEQSFKQIKPAESKSKTQIMTALNQFIVELKSAGVTNVSMVERIAERFETEVYKPTQKDLFLDVIKDFTF
jgi:hypothetical protein